MRACTRAYVCKRFQVNYSIIAVDILLFVAVVDRWPAAESGSLSIPFRAANSCDVARAFPPITVAVAVATVIFTARYRDLLSASVGFVRQLIATEEFIYENVRFEKL